MVNEHFDKIEAEFCLAEGGSVARVNREVQYSGVQTVEKLPYRLELSSYRCRGSRLGAAAK